MIGSKDILERLTVSQTGDIRSALEAIDRGARQIALVLDDRGVLVGTVTDGDIRRGLLRGKSLDSAITDVMRSDFASARHGDGIAAARQLMLEGKIHQIPMLDDLGRPVGLYSIDDFIDRPRHDTLVVLMAGGLGTRLRPLTDTIPKPMLLIGGKPLLEIIIRNFVEQGFYRFAIAINYRGDMIRSHFGDGSRFNAEIEYLEEDRQLGTAGALSLLTSRPESSFLVMNGDLLTAVPFEALMRFHKDTAAMATMCARDYPVQVPYGVIEVEDATLKRIVEKPTYSYFVNAGIYALAPEALDCIEPNMPLDMPTLFQRVIDKGAAATVFPIREYWLDIGRPEDLTKARSEFLAVRSDLLSDD